MQKNNVILIGGKSSCGKTTSLRNIRNPEGVLYLNCEAGKATSFLHKFHERIVTDPLTVPTGIEAWSKREDIHTIVIDSLSFLMEMFESNYVLTAANKMSAWSDYAQYFKKLMNQSVALSEKNIVFLTHTMDSMNESEMVTETQATVKGSLKGVGLESYFNTVISAKKLPLTKLASYTNQLLDITEEDEILGYKYVFQTKLTKDTVNERIRSHIGLWKTNETFINNDVQLVLDRINQYYTNS
jgi:hypothetical protein